MGHHHRHHCECYECKMVEAYKSYGSTTTEDNPVYYIAAIAIALFVFGSLGYVLYVVYDQLALVLRPKFGDWSPLWLAIVSFAVSTILAVFSREKATKCKRGAFASVLIPVARVSCVFLVSFVVIGGGAYAIAQSVNNSRTYNNTSELVSKLSSAVGRNPRILKAYLGNPFGNDWKETSMWFVERDLHWYLLRADKEGNSSEIEVTLWRNNDNSTKGIRVDFSGGSSIPTKEASALIDSVSEAEVCRDTYSVYDDSIVVKGRIGQAHVAVFIRNRTIKYEQIECSWDFRVVDGFRWNSGSVYQIYIGDAGPDNSSCNYVKAVYRNSNKLSAFLGADLK